MPSRIIAIRRITTGVIINFLHHRDAHTSYSHHHHCANQFLEKSNFCMFLSHRCLFSTDRTFRSVLLFNLQAVLLVLNFPSNVDFSFPLPISYLSWNTKIILMSFLVPRIYIYVIFLEFIFLNQFVSVVVLIWTSFFSARCFIFNPAYFHRREGLRIPPFFLFLLKYSFFYRFLVVHSPLTIKLGSNDYGWRASENKSILKNINYF